MQSEACDHCDSIRPDTIRCSIMSDGETLHSIHLHKSARSYHSVDACPATNGRTRAAGPVCASYAAATNAFVTK